MADNKVKLTNGQRWTAQQFLDHYRSAEIAGTPTPVGDAPAPVDVDRSWYMGEGPGRYYNPGMFPIINRLVNRRDLAPGTYDLWQLAPKKQEDPAVKASISHYFKDQRSEDFKMRALVFGTESARISGKVTVDQKGSKTFHGIEIRPLDSDLDFEHNTWNPFIEVPRGLARRKYDPENRGIKYDIQYRGPGPGQLYDTFTSAQLNSALRNPGRAPPGLLTSVTGKPPLQYASEHRQYLDQVNGFAAPMPQGGGAPEISGSNSVPYLSRRYDNSPASVPGPSVPVGAPVSAGSSDAFGGLAEWFATMAGVNPQNPMQPAPAPVDDELRGFYRDDPIQPWTLQRRR